MEIKRKYLGKYLHNIAIEQIADDYIEKGYAVSRDENLGNFRTDMIARKGSEQIVVEVKTGNMTSEKKQQIAGIADYVKNSGGYKFLVIVATPAKEKKLEIGNLKSLITGYITHSKLPSELGVLSTHTKIDEVFDISVDEINISGESIFVTGKGVVSVELRFGSDGDQVRVDGFKTFETFPFDFEITLSYNSKKELIITGIDKFSIDTSSYYD